MRHVARLWRLEAVEQEHKLFGLAQRLAAESGRDVAEVVIEVMETAARIDRFGLDAEMRRMARESGKSEAEVRAELDALIAKSERDDADA